MNQYRISRPAHLSPFTVVLIIAFTCVLLSFLLTNCLVVPNFPLDPPTLTPTASLTWTALPPTVTPTASVPPTHVPTTTLTPIPPSPTATSTSQPTSSPTIELTQTESPTLTPTFAETMTPTLTPTVGLITKPGRPPILPVTGADETSQQFLWTGLLGLCLAVSGVLLHAEASRKHR